MTTIYTGSNYGIISTANSGSGTLGASTIHGFSFELSKNYTSGSVLISLTGTPLCNLYINYSNDASGTVISTELHKYIASSTPSPTNTTIQFKPQGQYFRLRLENLDSSASVIYTVQTRLNNTANPEPTDGIISPDNSFSFPTGRTAFSVTNGIFEDISDYSLITVLARGTAASSASCTLECIFSMDGVNEDRIVTYTIQDVTANGSASSTTSLTFNPAHTLLPISRYFRVRLTNGSVALSTLRFTTTYHTTKSKPLTSRVTQSLTDQYDADTARSILVGRTLGTILPQGHYQNIGVENQAIATYIKEPLTAFGEVLTSQLTPQIQFDFSNGEPYEVMTVPIYRNSTANTVYTYTNSMLKLDVSGANTIINGVSSEYTKYKPGQGIDARFTAVFDTATGEAGLLEYAGLFTPENSLTFGFFDASGFAIRYGRGGIQQIIRIAVSGTATSTSTISLTFGGTTITTANITSGGNALQAAAAIVNIINSTNNLNNYGWEAYYFTPDGGTTATVEAIRSYAASNITVTIASPQIGYTLTSSNYRNGQATTYQYIYQNSWNMNTCKDMGSLQQNYLLNSTGFILDPTKGNVYRIVFQYLGFGSLTFFIENPQTERFIPVHQVKYANTAIVPNVTSPNYKLGFGIENTTNTGTHSISSASFSAFIQGVAVPAPLYRSYPGSITGNTLASIPKANARVLFGLRILRTKASTNSSTPQTISLNRSNLFLNSISNSVNITYGGGAGNTNANLIFQIVKNPTAFYLGDARVTQYNPIWRQYEYDSTIMVFDGLQFTSTTTGIEYTGGVNVFDNVLVENTSNTYDLRSTLINISFEDTYIVTVFGNTTGLTGYDLSAALSYQINN